MAHTIMGKVNLTDIADPSEGDKDFPELGGPRFACGKDIASIVEKTVMLGKKGISTLLDL
ncbi:MAG: hypothetical protein ABFS09_00585 [Thermodesulfobacteriota bacterium]